jgi:hypothetical protein
MAFKRIIATLTLLCLLVCLQGCYSNRFIPPEELEPNPLYTIVKVVTVSGQVIEFDAEDDGGAVLVVDEIKGMSKDGVLVCIPLSQVEKVYVKELEQREYKGVRAIAWILGISTIVAMLVVLALALFEEHVTIQ